MSVEDNFNPGIWTSSVELVNAVGTESQPEADVKPMLELNQPTNNPASATAPSGLDSPEVHGNAEPSSLTKLRRLLCEGFSDDYTWTSSGSVDEQNRPPCDDNEAADPSSCQKCLVRARSERVWSVPRGGQCRPGDDKTKKRRPRHQFAGDDEPYPYPPRSNRRFSGSGSMDLSVTESGMAGEQVSGAKG